MSGDQTSASKADLKRPPKKDPANPRKPPNRAAKSVKNSYTSPRTIRYRERAREALEHRAKGLSFRAIAQEMNIDPADACRLINWALDEIIREPAEQVLKLELARLDMMLSSVMSAAIAGDREAITTVLRLMERRTRYMGLDKVPAVRISAEGGANGAGTKVVFHVSQDDEKL